MDSISHQGGIEKKKLTYAPRLSQPKMGTRIGPGKVKASNVILTTSPTKNKLAHKNIIPIQWHA